MQKRIQIIFSGHVQGVGFRYRTHQTSQSFDVTGFVQNLEDGTVKLVAEGQASELQRFIEAVENRMDGFIVDRQTIDQEVVGEFVGFEIQ